MATIAYQSTTFMILIIRWIFFFHAHFCAHLLGPTILLAKKKTYTLSHLYIPKKGREKRWDENKCEKGKKKCPTSRRLSAPFRRDSLNRMRKKNEEEKNGKLRSVSSANSVKYALSMIFCHCDII